MKVIGGTLVELNQLALTLPRSIQSSRGRHPYEQRLHPHLTNITDLAAWLHKIEVGEKNTPSFTLQKPKANL